MKKILLLLSIISLVQCKSQENIIGTYVQDLTGEQYVLHADSTFKYESSGGIVFWTSGKWELKHDTVYLNTIPVYDTLRIAGFKDKLIKSHTDTSAKLIIGTLHYIDTQEDEFYSNAFASQMIINSKLYYKDNKLYEFDENKNLITEKERYWYNHKYYDPWFIKIEE